MKIGVLTAGGVAPGMNAAVRAVAQTAFSRGWEVVGKERQLDPNMYSLAEILAGMPE